MHVPACVCVYECVWACTHGATSDIVQGLELGAGNVSSTSFSRAEVLHGNRRRGTKRSGSECLIAWIEWRRTHR